MNYLKTEDQFWNFHSS